jgi:plastocyanin
VINVGVLSVIVSPSSWNLDVGQSTTFTATASGGSGTYSSYHWYVGGVSQSGATASTFNYAPASIGSYSITVTVTDNLGVTSTQSNAAVVKVNSALIAPIVSLSNSSVNQGQTVNFTSTVVSTGTSPYSYQWIQKAPGAVLYSQISGATSSSYSYVTSVSNAAGAWSFELQVTDNANTPIVVYSAAASVTVNVAQPVLDHFDLSSIGSQVAGTAFQITITAKDSSGNTVTSYAGTNTLSVSSGIITPTSTTAFTAGVWSGQVTLAQIGASISISTSGGGKSGTSNVFTINSSPSPIAASATPATLAVATGQTATFTASASGGSAPYTYQWYEGSAAMAGQTQATLSVTKSVAGLYNFYCKVTDAAAATANTNTITVSITISPTPLPSKPVSLLWGGVVVAIILIVTIAILFVFRRKRRLALVNPHKVVGSPTPPSLLATQLRVSADPLTLVADGASKSTLTFQLLDEEDKPASAATDFVVNIFASKGKLAQSLITLSKGSSMAQTFITASTELGSVLVTANAEGLRGGKVALNFKEEELHCLYCGSVTPSLYDRCPNCGRIPP